MKQGEIHVPKSPHKVRNVEEEIKDVLIRMFRSDIGSDPMKLIDLIAQNMALGRCNMEGSTPVKLIEKCKTSPLTKRLKEAGLW